MKVNAEYSDCELLLFLVKGEEWAFTEIYHRHWKPLYNAAYKRLKNIEQSKDVTQNIFIALWKRREELEIENLPAYLYTAVRYQVYKLMSRHKVSPHFFIPFELMLSSSDDVDEKIRQKDLSDLLSKWIETLPEKRKRIFTLHYKQHFSIPEIAEHMNISPKTIRN